MNVFKAFIDLLYDSLHAINEQYDPEAISLFVEWKMLPIAGIHPILHQCANCGATEGEFAFSFKEIGFLCHRCFHIDKYSNPNFANTIEVDSNFLYCTYPSGR